mgnify:CR=1 FL=1
MDINVSGNFTTFKALQFVTDLYQLAEEEEYYFDFSKIGFVNPFTLLYLSYHFKAFPSWRSPARYFAKNHQGHSYLSHMGFFQSFGVDYGKKPGEAKGSHTYIPITIITRQQAMSDSMGVNIGVYCENYGLKLAEILLGENVSPAFQIISYSIREMFRNIFEHSNAVEVSFCAQYWPKTGKAEIAILDNGIGIQNGLKTNPYLLIGDDYQALNLAMLPGISGKMFKGVKSNPKNEWENTGFGLYMTSQLCRLGGGFFIASGYSGINIDNHGKEHYGSYINGTILSMSINTREFSSSAAALIREISLKGKEISMELDMLDHINGEKASSYISNDEKRQLLLKR